MSADSNGSGEFCCINGDYKPYITSGIEKNCKIGILADLYLGNLKFFINGVSKGWALENEKKLT